MAQSTHTSNGASTIPDTVQSFATYPFATDADYQQGVQGILASGTLEGKSPAEQSEILLRSEVFYFNWKTGSALSVDDVRDHAQSRAAVGATPAASTPDSSAAINHAPTTETQSQPRELSFAELKALIEQGKTDQIPNNKAIPDELNSAPPSESTTAARKKPWE